MVGVASRDRSGAYNGGVHLEPPVSFLQDLLPASRVAPAVSEPEAGPDWFDQLTGGLGNAGFGELVCNNLTPPATTEQETSPVQRKIDEITARKGGFSNYSPSENAWDAAQWDRKTLDPKNKDEDLAAAEHYLWGKASADKTERDHGGGVWGNLLAMGDAAATGVMAVGYEGLKAGAFAMKDHNMLLGAAMMSTGIGIPAGLAMMAGGDTVADWALHKVSATDELPSDPSLKSLGWGLKGAGDAFGEHFLKMFE